MGTASAADRARFEAVFEAHHRRVFAYALRRCAGEADAEDIVAETFTVAWRRVGDLPPRERALPWLVAVARRTAANQRRGSLRRVGLFDRLRSQPVAPAAPVPESQAMDALLRLRPDDQELLRLVAWEGLDHAEIGEVLGISANAVAIRLHRARQRYVEVLAAVAAEDLKGSDPSRTPTSTRGRMPGQATEEPTT